jgi:uncharacterized RDD family membrane protein YckC
VDAVLARVDVDGLLARVDVDAVLARVDLDAVLARVDLDAVLGRVDVDAVVDRVDVEAVIQRAGIRDIVAESTTSVLQMTIDTARRQLLGVDIVVSRVVSPARFGRGRSLPAGPAALMAPDAPGDEAPPPGAAPHDVNGHYAGPITRLAAFAIDFAVAGGTLTLISGALGSVLQTLGMSGAVGGFLLSSAALLWLLMYWWASTAIVGRTPGMGLVGLRVVTRAGAPLSGWRALVRVVTMPLSFLLFGLGLVGIVVDPERRALHDVFAGSTVVYDWGGRVATMPTPLARWLEQRAVPVQAATAVDVRRAGDGRR